MSSRMLRVSFWQCSSHTSLHQSSWPWPISVCFAFMQPASIEVYSVKHNSLWLRNCSPGGYCVSSLSLHWAWVSSTTAHVSYTPHVTCKTCKTFHHRKFLHVEAPLLCSASRFKFQSHWHFAAKKQYSQYLSTAVGACLKYVQNQIVKGFVTAWGMFTKL